MSIAEVREFTLTKLPVAARFGLGSTEAIKRWSRFTVGKTGDLYWVNALYIRADIDKTNEHLSVHGSGQIMTSLYQGRQKIDSRPHGNLGCSLREITKPYHVTSGQEFLEPGYLYYGLVTLHGKDKVSTPDSIPITCLDDKIVNSRLHYSFDLLPWTKCEQVINYATQSKTPFNLDDQRSHIYIFYYEKASIVITMKFTEGNEPINIQKLHEADQHPQSLKRLLYHETLSLSESVSLRTNHRRHS